jgi:adenosine deaminase
MNHMLNPVVALGQFTAADIANFMINAFDAAWLPRSRRDAYIQKVKSYLAEHDPARNMHA